MKKEYKEKPTNQHDLENKLSRFLHPIEIPMGTENIRSMISFAIYLFQVLPSQKNKMDG